MTAQIVIKQVTDWTRKDMKTGESRKRFGFRLAFMQDGPFQYLSTEAALKHITDGTGVAANKPTADALAKVGA